MNYYTTTGTISTTSTTIQKDSPAVTIIGIIFLIVVAIICSVKGLDLVYDLKAEKCGSESIRKFIFWIYFANVFIGGFWGIVSGLVVEAVFKNKLCRNGVDLSQETNKSLTKKAILGITIAFGAKIVFAIMLVAIVNN